MTNLNLALTPAVTTNSLTILPWFPPSAQTWDQSSFPQGSNESYDQFGYVLVGGDFDGDGYGELNIGSPRQISLQIQLFIRSVLAIGRIHAPE